VLKVISEQLVLKVKQEQVQPELLVQTELLVLPVLRGNKVLQAQQELLDLPVLLVCLLPAQQLLIPHYNLH
jgi:hypothetical protein